MADLVLCEKQDLVNIADSIRAKNGGGKPLSIGEMDDAISEIESGNSESGNSETVTMNFVALSDPSVFYEDSLLFYSSGGACYNISLYQIASQGLLISVPKGSIIATRYYNDLKDIYSCSDAGFVDLGNQCSYAIVDDITFTYSDNAPL